MSMIVKIDVLFSKFYTSKSAADLSSWRESTVQFRKYSRIYLVHVTFVPVLFYGICYTYHNLELHVKLI